MRDFIETARIDDLRYDVRREDSTLLAFAHGLCEALEPLVPSAKVVADWFSEYLRRSVLTIVLDDLKRGAPQIRRP